MKLLFPIILFTVSLSAQPETVPPSKVSKNVIAEEIALLQFPEKKLHDSLELALERQVAAIASRVSLTQEETDKLRNAFVPGTLKRAELLFRESQTKLLSDSFSLVELDDILRFFKSSSGQAFLTNDAKIRKALLTTLVEAAQAAGQEQARQLSTVVPEIARKIQQAPDGEQLQN